MESSVWYPLKDFELTSCGPTFICLNSKKKERCILSKHAMILANIWDMLKGQSLNEVDDIIGDYYQYGFQSKFQLLNTIIEVTKLCNKATPSRKEVVEDYINNLLQLSDSDDEWQKALDGNISEVVEDEEVEIQQES